MAALAVPSMGTAADVSASAEAALLSAYVWRGQVINDEAVLQPAATVEAAGFALNFWGNLNLTDSITDSGEFNEIDTTLSYSPSFSSEEWGLDLGVIHYTFPNTTVETDTGVEAANDTTEVFARASYDWVVTPSLTVYYDFNQVEGFYVLGALGYSAPLDKYNEALSLDFELATSYSDSEYNLAYFGLDESKIGDALFSATIGYAVNDAVDVSGILSYSWFWDSDMEEAAEAGYLDKDQFYGGVAVSYGF
jgi:hypothetical protein